MIRIPGRQVDEERPVVVLGSGGMLGTAVVDALKDQGRDFVPLHSKDMDIKIKKQVDAVLKELNPSIVINMASYTNVDGAESESRLAFDLNGTGAGNVASVASVLSAAMVHISTDYVFDGNKKGPYLPGDDTNPLNVYGASKLEGEKQVRNATPTHLILRTSWLFGPNGKNFVRTMLDLGRTRSSLDVVNDQTGSPTYTRHLAKAILDLVDRKVTGTWHLTNAGECTWCTFAREIFRQRGMPVEVNPVSTEAFPRPALRPQNSVLECSATYEILGEPLPSWQEALEEYLKEMPKE